MPSFQDCVHGSGPLGARLLHPVALRLHRPAHRRAVADRAGGPRGAGRPSWRRPARSRPTDGSARGACAVAIWRRPRLGSSDWLRVRGRRSSPWSSSARSWPSRATSCSGRNTRRSRPASSAIAAPGWSTSTTRAPGRSWSRPTRCPSPCPTRGEDGEKAGDVYENVQVLGDVSAGEFTRLMVNITEWVAPEQGCAACHNTENFADDKLYTKVVARRMLQMIRHINADWTKHVAPDRRDLLHLPPRPARAAEHLVQRSRPAAGRRLRPGAGRPEPSGGRDPRQLVAAARPVHAVPGRRQRDPRPVHRGAAAPTTAIPSSRRSGPTP